jgi:hypothetical protein
MGLKQAGPKTNEYKFALLIIKQKGFANTNEVKGKLKVLKGSTSNTQVQVLGRGEGARRTTKRKSLTMLLMMRHATPPKKKGTTSETRNTVMSLTLAAKERSGPSLTSGLSDHTGKGGRGGYNGRSQHRGKEGAETPETGGKLKNCLPSGSIWGEKRKRKKAHLLTNSNLPDRLPHSSSWKLWTRRVLFFSCLTLPLLLFLALSILPSGFLRGARSNERGRSPQFGCLLACWLHQPLFAFQLFA